MIADRIEDAHRLDNYGQIDDTFKQNLHDTFKQNLHSDVIQCFIRGLGAEIEIHVKTK